MKTKTEQIRQRKAALHNCEGFELLRKAGKIIWPKCDEIVGLKNYYVNEMLNICKNNIFVVTLQSN